jgi:hypothetical protein
MKYRLSSALGLLATGRHVSITLKAKKIQSQPQVHKGLGFDFPRAGIHSLLLFEAIDLHWQNYKKT